MTKPILKQYTVCGVYLSTDELVTHVVAARTISEAIASVVEDLDADAEDLQIVSVFLGEQNELNTATHLCSANEWPGKKVN